MDCFFGSESSVNGVYSVNGGVKKDMVKYLLESHPDKLLSSDAPDLSCVDKQQKSLLYLFKRSILYQNDTIQWKKRTTKLIYHNGLNNGFFSVKKELLNFLDNKKNDLKIVIKRRRWKSIIGNHWKKDAYELVYDPKIDSNSNQYVLIHYRNTNNPETTTIPRNLKAEADKLTSEILLQTSNREQSNHKSSIKNHIVVFSGGTAINPFSKELTQYTDNVSYILPVSDDGGSSREIRRVLGGPSIGDIRSRCIRLAKESDTEFNIFKLLSHRLNVNSREDAISEWFTFMNGTHILYNGVHPHLKDIVKKFLIEFNSATLAKQTEPAFDFRNGAIGNFFITGLRHFFNSLETAIFLFSRLSFISPLSQIIPIIDTNAIVSIGCELVNGDHIKGQNEISHPSNCTIVDKGNTYNRLSAPIKRLYYMNEKNQDIVPEINPSVLRAINQDDSVIVYGIGSLWTSLIPNLVLKGIGESIGNLPPTTLKLLLLNGTMDRETHTMTANDIIQSITNSLNRYGELNYPPSAFITHLLYTPKTEFEIDFKSIENLGIKIIAVEGDAEGNIKLFDVKDLTSKIIQIIHQHNMVSAINPKH
jgi:cathepsin L